MDEVIVKETIRADFAYNMGIKAEDVGDDIVEMLYRERHQNRFGFNKGGSVLQQGVGDLFGVRS